LLAKRLANLGLKESSIGPLSYSPPRSQPQFPSQPHLPFTLRPSRLRGQKFPKFLAKSPGFIARFLGGFAIETWEESCHAHKSPSAAPQREIDR
jgi:hypothetical protein